MKRKKMYENKMLFKQFLNKTNISLQFSLFSFKQMYFVISSYLSACSASFAIYTFRFNFFLKIFQDKCYSKKSMINMNKIMLSTTFLDFVV